MVPTRGDLWHDHQCEKTGRVLLDGEWYCAVHDPTEVARRDRKREVRWNAEQEKRRQQWKAQELGMLMIEAGYDTEDKVRELITKAKS